MAVVRKSAGGVVSALKNKGIARTGVPLSFLLGCSESALGNFELARLADAANLRTELHTILDRVIDAMAQAALASWFRTIDVETLKSAVQEPEDVLLWARERIRTQQRSDAELVPLTSLPPGAAHLAAALRYTERNIAEGKCAVCPKPLDRNSVRYCTEHLTAARHSHEKKGRAAPGSREYLYSEEKQPSTHGRTAGTLAALAMGREQRTRKVLAEAGIPPESAAISLKAAKDALLRMMPESKASAMSMAELFEAAVVPSRTTGQKALRELLSEGKIQRTGKGGMRDVFRYFVSDVATRSNQ